ncbi:VWA domain-containing protein [Metabacillus idriensis]|uniref:vWA domain-containing protein n=1 Tax=Metabacillus idriensis TaxID=324768 RepID=UPI0028134CB1|nr:VWA domain-containing protein [Metabacillus idriensis]MDR0139213.1 VWA domain-containing protein [Metabacillus idriensis]
MNDKLTEIIFLLDRSGSMGGLEKDVIGGFNSFVENQCKFEGDTMLTTVLFDDEYVVLWSGADAKSIQLTEEEYYVRGLTSLLDAIGKTIIDVGRRLSNTSDEQRPGKVIFVITTDGQENASKEFSYEKVNELIKHQQEKYSWEFIFMGANIDVAKEAVNIGIKSTDAYSFEASEIGMKEMYEVVCQSVNQIRADSLSDKE